MKSYEHENTFHTCLLNVSDFFLGTDYFENSDTFTAIVKR